MPYVVGHADLQRLLGGQENTLSAPHPDRPAPAEPMTNLELAQLPTVAELRAMSDEELVARHDALVARSHETGAPASDIYLGELGRRISALQAERTMRIALAALMASGVAVVAVLFVLVLAL
jgi:hypothetical protein